jgi:hypothetical protein
MRGYEPLMAGVRGFEPQLTDPESAVIPLNDTPLSVTNVVFSVRGTYNTAGRANCQALVTANFCRLLR